MKGGALLRFLIPEYYQIIGTVEYFELRRSTMGSIDQGIDLKPQQSGPLFVPVSGKPLEPDTFAMGNDGLGPRLPQLIQ